MTVNITANVVNVVFNYLLIEGNFGFPRLEVAGAAIATVIGNAVGFSLALRSLTRKDTYLRLTLRDNFRPDIPMLRGLTRLGGSSMIEQAAMRVGFFAYARIIAELGTNAFAAHQIAMQLMGLSFTFADGISVASTSLVGQNLGRKRPDLAMMYGKIGQRFAFVVAVALGVGSFLGRDFFPLLFTQDRGIVALTAEIIMILAFIQPFQTSQVVMGGSLRGAGDTRYVALTMLVTVMLVRPLASLIFIYGFQLGLAGAWYAILFDQTLRLAMLFTRFSRGKWAHIRV
jgi:putative MATE family efflux protein